MFNTYILLVVNNVISITLRDLNCGDTEHVTKQYTNNIAELSHQKALVKAGHYPVFKSDFLIMDCKDIF